MSFQTLNVEELKKVVEFFAVDVQAANPEKPTKKELVASLAAGDEPVTWDQYNEMFLPNQKPEPEDIEEEDAPEPVEEKKDKYADSNTLLIKYERKNPTFEILGYTFNTRHPYASVPEEVAEYLVRNVKGFRLALTSEVKDYYN